MTTQNGSQAFSISESDNWHIKELHFTTLTWKFVLEWLFSFVKINNKKLLGKLLHPTGESRKWVFQFSGVGDLGERRAVPLRSKFVRKVDELVPGHSLEASGSGLHIDGLGGKKRRSL
jgi:hypothetical protein